VSDDLFPRWPPEWLEDHELELEEAGTEPADVQLVSAMRSDGQVLVSVTWPGGRRYLRVDPSGDEDPEALRIGEPAEDPDVARMVEGVWSQALKLAKQLIDGDVELPPEPPPASMN
jgi:hypothetical protein